MFGIVLFDRKPLQLLALLEFIPWDHVTPEDRSEQIGEEQQVLVEPGLSLI
ncbi:hypothetical protein D3C81_2243120 [compost metagenome]